MHIESKGTDPFEQRLKDSLGQFEVPYNSADWTQLENALDGNKRGWWGTRARVSAVIAGLALLAGTAWYTVNRPEVPESMTAEAQRSGSTTNIEPMGPVGEKPATVSETGSGHLAAVEPEGDLASSKADNTDQQAGQGVKNSPEEPQRTAVASTSASSRSTQAALSSTKEAPSPSSDAAFHSSVAEGCPGTSVEFKVANMPADGIYLWNFGDGNFSNKANPEHTFTKPGTYQVMLSMSAAGVGSIQNKPSSEVIVIHEAPMAAFNVLKQEYDGHLPSVHFENRSMAGKSYHWDFGDGQSSTVAYPDHIYKKKGIYHVELTVANAIGCEDKLMKDVVVDKDYNLDAPASFSPNGDNFQETFMPEALRTLGAKFNLQIYASNGTLLYQTTDASKPWTGRPQNRGALCAPGEYVWVADVHESLHLSETYTGKVRMER